MFAAEHYLTRAGQLEDASKRLANGKIRESYIELARTFREMANLAKTADPAAAAEVEHRS